MRETLFRPPPTRKIRELVAHTTAFTENMERRFAEAEGKKQ